MARSPRSAWSRAEPEPAPSKRKLTWNAAAAAALLVAAPVTALQAGVNAGAAVPRWAHGWNGFRLADDARARLTGDPKDPQAGLTLGPGAAALARRAYAREPLASDALVVLALDRTPLSEDYRADAVARRGAALDQRNALLQLLLIADAAGRADFDALFRHADLLAAAHPRLAQAVLAPVFDRLGDPATVPLVSAALAREPHWAPAFRSHAPDNPAALRNYLALRRQAGFETRWPSDPGLVAALIDNGLYGEAFATWRSVTGAGRNDLAFVAGDGFAPIGWRVVSRGDRMARVDQDGTMTVSLERGTGGELARQLVQLAPGRYRLDTTIDASTAGAAPLSIALRCADPAGAVVRVPLTARTEFAVGEAGCPAWWLMVEGSALDSRHRVEATLADWRLTRVR